MISLDEHKSIGTNWILLYVNGDIVTHFDIFGDEYIPKEMKKSISNKNITTNTHKIQANDSIMCGYRIHLLYAKG